jgi:hypothetical protein
MRLLGLAFVSALLLAPVGLAKQATHPRACALKDNANVTLTGIARSVMSGAQEPQESINTYFLLETSGPPCGKQEISVFAPGIIACSEGDHVTVRGVYYAPGEIITWPMIDMAKVTCS